MSEICQLSIDDRSSHSDQLTIMIEIIKTLCNRKTGEKVLYTQKNQGDQGNDDSNTNSKSLKFVSFPSTIDQIILINLHLQ